MPNNNFESTKFGNFEEIVHNFGRSDDYMISWKNVYFWYKQTWFDAQLDHKILDDIYLSGNPLMLDPFNIWVLG